MLSTNPEFHFQIKHIDVKFHLIRESISIMQLHIIYILIVEMTANAFNKNLLFPSFLKFRRMIGIGTGS